jgi:hypothetical protein
VCRPRAVSAHDPVDGLDLQGPAHRGQLTVGEVGERVSLPTGLVERGGVEHRHALVQRVRGGQALQLLDVLHPGTETGLGGQAGDREAALPVVEPDALDATERDRAQVGQRRTPPAAERVGPGGEVVIGAGRRGEPVRGRAGAREKPWPRGDWARGVGTSTVLAMSLPPQQPPGPGQPGGQPSPYGPPPGGGQPYGSQPYGSPYPGQQPPPGYQVRGPAAPVEKPKEVETAFRLGLLSVAISIVGIALGFAVSGPALDAAIAANPMPPGFTEQQFRQAALIGSIVFAVFLLIIICVYLLFLFKMRAGRNWARIVLTILGLLWIAFGLYGLMGVGQVIAAGPLGIVSAVLSVLQLVVLAASIFFMFRPAAGAYFQQERP